MVCFRFGFAVGAMVMLAGCGGAPVNHEDERTALMQVSREWAQAAASGDVDRIVSYWADDAMVLAPDQPAIVGKAALREYVLASQQIPGFSITWEPERVTIAEGGDLAYLIEHNRATFADADGAVQTQYGKVVTIWRKDAAGAWKCVVDIWNNNPQETVLSSIGPELGGSRLYPAAAPQTLASVGRFAALPTP